MCGRVVQKTPLGEIRVLFETTNPVPNAAPIYNGAPTDTLQWCGYDRLGRHATRASFTRHLVGAGEQRLPHREAARFCPG
jgi:hypothetical protein